MDHVEGKDMTDTLTCEKCGRKGFTKDGLARHSCKPAQLSVMPARQQGLAAVEPLVEQVRGAYDLFKKRDAEAGFLALQIGLFLVWAKPQIPQGQFETWRESVLGISDRHARRFASAAWQAMARNELKGIDVEMLMGGGSQAEQKANEQLLMDFIGDRSQSELFDDLRASATAGGDNLWEKWLKQHHPEHAGKKRISVPKSVRDEFDAYRTEKDAEKFGADRKARSQQAAEDHYDTLIENIRTDMLHTQWFKRLPAPMLRRLSSTLLDMKRAVDAEIAKL